MSSPTRPNHYFLYNKVRAFTDRYLIEVNHSGLAVANNMTETGGDQWRSKANALVHWKMGTSEEEVNEGVQAINHINMLMNAARNANEEVIVTLFLEQFDLASVDEDGNTALHIAAMNGHCFICRMIVVLVSPVRIWEVKNKAGLTAEDLTTDQRIRQDLQFLRKGEARVEDEITRWNDRLVQNTVEWKKNGKVLLALDGGGIKSLVIAQILLCLEYEMGVELVTRLDWIAGTSSGGISALMLGDGKPLKEAKRFFLNYRFRVFCGNKVKVPKHSSRGLDEAAKVLFGNRHMGSFPKNGPRVMVTVADTRRTPANLVLLRSFAPKIPESLKEHFEYLDPDKILIWKAARCTCAAPLYFDSYNGLSDGGIVANNPTLALMADFFRTTRLEKEYSPSTGKDPCPSMACVISVGTGSGPAESTNGVDVNFNAISNKKNPLQIARGFMTVVNSAKNMFQMLVTEELIDVLDRMFQCTSSSGQPVRYSREWCHSLDVPFFRLSPPFQKNVQLDSTDLETLIEMLWETECYIRGQGKYDIQQLAKFLSKKPPHTVEDKKEAIIETKQ